MADRFYLPDPPEAGRATLVGGEAHHLARVRRVEVGQIVEVFDGRGWASRARVGSIHKDRVDLEVVGDPLPDRTPSCRVTLATAVPKGDRFDWLIEKATELGVGRLVAVVAERSAVDPRAAKLDRLRRHVIEAAKQSGRNRLMALEGPVPLDDYLRSESAASRFVAHPGGGLPSRWPAAGEAAAVAIGPEGGLTERELDLAREAGWGPIGLGPATLRIETAGIVGCAVILSRAGEGVG